MQNLPNEAGPKRPGPPNVSLAALAQPKVVLLAAGLLGLAVDLFVRPLSWVGLALIVLATMPWLLQAWSLRAAPAAKGTAAVEPANPARADQRIATAAATPAASRPQVAATVAREAPRAAAPTDPLSRPPAKPARMPEPDPRTVAPRAPQARTAPPRSPETPAAARPVRPEPAR